MADANLGILVGTPHDAVAADIVEQEEAGADRVASLFQLVIRGGTILDGDGAAAFTGDVAIDGAKIVQVGATAGLGRREIDANGLLVTPGWVDVHTHYDGQATWDPVLAPSSWHGVTTILFGNCGVGFAPARKEHRAELIDLMEAVEDIPGTALHAGLTWEWESFPQYLDALERLPRTIDIAAPPHHYIDRDSAEKVIFNFLGGKIHRRHEPVGRTRHTGIKDEVQMNVLRHRHSLLSGPTSVAER